MNNFDLSNLALQMSGCANNKLIYDDKGMPSVMVEIPKMTYAELGISAGGNDIFPAFIVNGKTLDSIFIGKYQSMIHSDRAYSLPNMPPRVNVIMDESVQYSANKGKGWHEMTKLEHTLIGLICTKIGHFPKGNNNYGKDISESIYTAIPCGMAAANIENRYIVRTGTGNVSWSHNNAQDGIYDMNGNGWDWMTGVRLVYGELQVISKDGSTFGNDCADNTISQTADSANWFAIRGSDGALITPDGSGTTAGSVKLNSVSDHWEWTTNAITRAPQGSWHYYYSVTCDSTISAAAKAKIQAVGMLKPDNLTTDPGDMFYAHTQGAEQLCHCGGDCNDGAGAGVFSLSFNVPRSARNWNVGCRVAFVTL